MSIDAVDALDAFTDFGFTNDTDDPESEYNGRLVQLVRDAENHPLNLALADFIQVLHKENPDAAAAFQREVREIFLEEEVPEADRIAWMQEASPHIQNITSYRDENSVDFSLVCSKHHKHKHKKKHKHKHKHHAPAANNSAPHKTEEKSGFLSKCTKFVEKVAHKVEKVAKQVLHSGAKAVENAAKAVAKASEAVVEFVKEHPVEVTVAAAIVVAAVIIITTGGTGTPAAAGLVAGASSLGNDKKDDDDDEAEKTPRQSSSPPPPEGLKVPAVDWSNGASSQDAAPSNNPTTIAQDVTMASGNTYIPPPTPTGEMLLASNRPQLPPSPYSSYAAPAATLPVSTLTAATQPIDNYWAFSWGMTKGVVRGGADGVANLIPNTLHAVDSLSQGAWHFMLDPVQTTSNVYHSVQGCVDYIKTHSALESIEHVVPEVRDLVGQWDRLSDSERGEKVGYIIGKYGVEVFAPGAAMKGVKAFQELRQANRLMELGSDVVRLQKAGDFEALAKLLAQENVTVAEQTALANSFAVPGVILDEDAVMASRTCNAAADRIQFAPTPSLARQPGLIEPPVTAGIRIQPSGIWEIEGNSIKRFNMTGIIKDDNKIEHLFDSKHQLSKLQRSNEEIIAKVTYSVIEADRAGQIPLNKLFEIRVPLDGFEVEVRGIVLNGELRYGTFFIPEK